MCVARAARSFKLIPRIVNVEEWAEKGPLSQPEYKLLLSYNDKPVLTRPQVRRAARAVRCRQLCTLRLT